MNWYIRGDMHGNISCFRNYPNEEQTAVIILGDAGFNYLLDNRDKVLKKKLAKIFKGYVYIVRGNHEERPENLEYEVLYDAEVCGDIYLDPVCDRIRYFLDGGEYTINGHSILVIGGAYSVDKHYRLARAFKREDGKVWSGWFQDEQLTEQERKNILSQVKNKSFDFILTHTCPISWEPTDLFLNCINQSTVDKSTEIWLEEVKNACTWGVWCFGHYHCDRLERPRVEQFFNDCELLENVWKRWYLDTELDWWLNKSPNYYQGG